MTHPGLIRSSNEDVLEAGTILKQDSGGIQTKIHYIITCDGMGGMKAGGTASQTTCQTVVNYLQSIPFWPGLEEDVVKILEEAVLAAHQSLTLLSDIDFDKSGMGSTLAILLIHKKRAYAHWIGDSRIYLLSKRNEVIGFKQEGLDLLTKDHSINWNLAESGILTLDQIRNAPGGHVLTQSIGNQSIPVPETKILDVINGDRFLVCTDGVNLHLDTKEIYNILNGYTDQKTVIQKMQDIILFKGAKDNFSIGIVDIVDVQWKEPVLTKPAASKKRRKGIYSVLYLLPVILGIGFMVWKTNNNKFSLPASEDMVSESKYPTYTSDSDLIQKIITADGNVKTAYQELDSANFSFKKNHTLLNADTSSHIVQADSKPVSESSQTKEATSLDSEYFYKIKEYDDLYKKIKEHYQQYIKSHPKPDIPQQSYLINLELLMGEVENNKNNNDFKNLKNINWQIQYLTKKFTDLQSKLSNLQ